MKTNHYREITIKGIRILREEEWMKIYGRWVEVRNEVGAVDRLMKEFCCSGHKVKNAISYGLKYSETGTFKSK
jgi:hypothetical protein